jgi:hypothetical protein
MEENMYLQPGSPKNEIFSMDFEMIEDDENSAYLAGIQNELRIANQPVQETQYRPNGKTWVKNGANNETIIDSTAKNNSGTIRTLTYSGFTDVVVPVVTSSVSAAVDTSKPYNFTVFQTQRTGTKYWSVLAPMPYLNVSPGGDVSMTIKNRFINMKELIAYFPDFAVDLAFDKTSAK